MVLDGKAVIIWRWKFDLHLYYEGIENPPGIFLYLFYWLKPDFAKLNNVKKKLGKVINQLGFWKYWNKVSIFPIKPTNHRMPCKERGGGFYLFIRWTKKLKKKFVSPLKLRKRKKPYKDKTTQAYLSVFKNRGTEDFKVYFLSSLNPQSGFIPFFSGRELGLLHILVLSSLPKQIKVGAISHFLYIKNYLFWQIC